MKILSVFLILLLTSSLPAIAQLQNIELNGGYVHISGDGGLDGFNVGAAVWFTHRVTIGAEYESGWDSSHLGAFELTSGGIIVTKNHLQDFLIGPRVFFPGLLKRAHISHLLPFGEAQFGVSHLSSRLESPVAMISQSASDNAFTWLLGGGVDYRFSGHWHGRAKLDLERTHFSDTGQSRLRVVLGVAYTFGERGKEEVAAAKRKADEQERTKQELRARLLENLNRVLPTTDTPRGLVVDMGDVLFDTGKSNLRTEGREDLAKLSGIVINYPKLRLTIEGHTDNSGKTELNQRLSEQRANAVRDYLVQQGLNRSSLSAQGLGDRNPVADNSTAEGREKNRRVEIIVSGEILGTPIGAK